MFDGVGDYVSLPANAAFAFGTSDFTVEAWVYVASFAAGTYSQEGDRVVRLLSAAGAVSDFDFHVESNGVFHYWNGLTLASLNSPTAGFPLSTWCHVAFARGGGEMRGYLNGSLVGSVSDPSSLASTLAVRFPGTGSYSSAYMWIDELRVTKGVARYTGSTYTVPDAPFPAE
jgi:hypothetical protein